MLGEFSENVARGIGSELVREPIRVVAAICPFNFLVMIPLWMFSIALACGNTFVLKPSDRTPLSSVVDLLEQAGLPPGVLNVVYGAKTRGTKTGHLAWDLQCSRVTYLWSQAGRLRHVRPDRKPAIGWGRAENRARHRRLMTLSGSVSAIPLCSGGG